MNPKADRKILLVCLILLFTLQLYSQKTDTVRISEQFSNLPVTEALKLLEAHYNIKFFYKENWFDGFRLNLVLDSATLDESLANILAGKAYEYRIVNNNKIVFLPSEEVSLLTGNLKNFTETSSVNQGFILVGKPEEAGKQKTPLVTGKITDGKTGEPIIGAMIQVNNLNQGAATDADGNYKLLLSPGFYTLSINSVGYERSELYVKLISNGTLNIELFDKAIAIEDIVIYGERVDKNVTSNQMSLVELDMQSIKQLPVVTGDKDVLKGLTTMPGIKSVGEFSSGINVRGGGEDQNLYLLNGAPLFNTTHVFGLFSVVNPDVVDKLTLYKGHIPAYYGERVSSVVDIQTIEEAPEKIRVKGGIGLYDSKLTFIVPLYKKRIFLDLSGRTSYSDWILKKTNEYYLSNSSALFYDLQGTLHFNLPQNIITLSGYTCFDEFRFASEVNYAYGSILGSLKWNYFINPNIGSYLTVSYSNYKVKKENIASVSIRNRIESGIQYAGLNYRLKYTGIMKNTLDGGLNLINYFINPGESYPLGNASLLEHEKLETESAWETALFINDEYNLSNSITFNAGLRVSGYKKTGTPSLFGFEPRFSTRIKLGNTSSVKLSYNRNFQYISMISLSSVSTPGDIWKLSNTKIKPLIANQIALGFYRNFFNNSIESSVEIYYKGLKNITEYADGAELEMNSNLDDILLNAEGRNYGIEFLLRKNSGTIDGWISYTYSRSFRRTPDKTSEVTINDGRYFPSSYDKPHDLAVVANLHINRRLRISANFSYSTGRPITIPEYVYTIDKPIQYYDVNGNLVTGYNEQEAVVYSDRNEYRIPDYHRLDISISLDESLKRRKSWKGSWTFSILNVYGRKNPYTVFYRHDEVASSQNNYNFFNMYKLYLIGKPIPTLSYTFIF